MLCPTRRTVIGDAVESILKHWSTLSHLRDECLNTCLDLEVKAHIIWVNTKLSGYDMLFGIQLSKIILKHTYNFSQTLQQQSMSEAEGYDIAGLPVATLQGIWSDEEFEHFLALVDLSLENLEVDSPSLPCNRRAPAQFVLAYGVRNHVESVEDLYRQKYYKGLNLCIEMIKDCFNQPGYAIYRNLEEVLAMAANGNPLKEQLKTISCFFMMMACTFYCCECSCKALAPFSMEENASNLQTVWLRSDR